MMIGSIEKCKNNYELEKWFAKNKYEIFSSEAASINISIMTIIERQTKKTQKNSFSQSDIAKAIGIDTSTINRFFNGSRHPNKYIWYRIGLLGNFTYDEMKYFMAAAGYILNVNVKTDTLLIYSFCNNLSIYDTYSLLVHHRVSEKVINELFPTSPG